MKCHIIRKHKSQGGFTLIEILIAVTILAILTLPVLSAFSSAAKLNHTARQQENCNAIGQLFAERCKSLSLEDMLSADSSEKEAYGIDTITADPDEATDKTYKTYILKSVALDSNGNNYTSTSEGEKYYVEVEFSPDSYVDSSYLSSTMTTTTSTDTEENNINSYEVPQISNIRSDYNYVIQSQVYAYDNSVQTMLGGIDLDDAYREVDVNVTITDRDSSGSLNQKTVDGVTHTIYTQTVTFAVTYHSYSDPSQVSDTEEYQIGSCEVLADDADSIYKNVYLFYNSFDIYRTDGLMDQSRDVINLNVTYNTTTGKLNSTTDLNGNILEDKMLNLYLVEQDTASYNSSSVYVKLQRSNIHVSVNGTSVSLTNGSIIKTLGLGTNQLLNIYTNADCLTNTDSGNSITQSTTDQTNTGYLYDMTVKVGVGQLPETVESTYLTFRSTKENYEE